MRLEDVQQIVAQGESESVELKRTTGQLTRAGESLCAMLNGQGGVVVVGVSDAGEIVGQEVADSTLQRVAAMLRDFEPQAPIQLERVLLDTGSEVLVFEARPTEGEGPWVYRGRPWQRLGVTNGHMPQSVYQGLVLRTAHQAHRWELAEAAGCAQADLDAEEILRTVRLGIDAGRLPEDTGDSVPDILERFALTVDGRPRNAAVVLFGVRPEPTYPQCGLRLARFKGTTKDEFIDERQLRGHAFLLLNEAMAFMLRHIPVSGTFVAGAVVRQDRPIFPVAALREAVVNALIHRDYAVAGGSVSIAIFDDRLEVWSTGGLPSGITADSLKQEHMSQPPNPTLADVFYRRGLIEQWGRGTQKIVRLCVAEGHPEPEFEEVSGSVCVRFIPRTSLGPPRVTTELSERQAKIVAFLSRTPTAPLREIKGALTEEVATRTLQDDLDRLRSLGLVESGGRGRGAKWWLVRGE